MSASKEQEVITFENLFRPTGDVVGELQQLKAVIPATEPFVNANAAGETREISDLIDIKLCATRSGEKLKAAFCA